MSNAFSDLLKQTTDSLKTMGDELRLKAHLAGLDAKDKWQELQPEIDDLEERVKDGLDSMQDKLNDGELGLQIHLAMMEARDKWRDLEPRVEPLIDKLAHAGEAVDAAVEGFTNKDRSDDNVKGEDAHTQRRDRIRKQAAAHRERVGDVGEELEETATAAVGEVKDGIERLKQKLGQA